MVLVYIFTEGKSTLQIDSSRTIVRASGSVCQSRYLKGKRSWSWRYLLAELTITHSHPLKPTNFCLSQIAIQANNCCWSIQNVSFFHMGEGTDWKYCLGHINDMWTDGITSSFVHSIPPPLKKTQTFSFFLFGATPVAYGNSQARGRIRAVAILLCHRSQQCRIPDRLSEARDWTLILMNTVKFPSAAPQWKLWFLVYFWVFFPTLLLKAMGYTLKTVINP